MRKLVLAAILAVHGCGNKSAPATTGSGSGSAGEGDALPFVETARTMLVGHVAPAATLELLDGTRVELAKLVGQKPIYLKFWATWCVPCRAQMPHLEATFQAHADKLAVYAIDVGVDDPIENVRDMVRDKKLSMPVAYDRDGSVAEQFFLNVTPQHVLVDRAGVVRYVGHAVTPELEKMLATILSESPGNAVNAPLAPAPSHDMPALALDNGAKLDLATRPKKAAIALTFATLFCDDYIADSRPQIGAACAAHAKQVAAAHAAHPDLEWVIVAWPVWTGAGDITEFRKRLGLALPIGIDRGNAWFRHFDVRDSYTTILLDASGAELGRADGDKLAALVDKAR